jgi:hypothetical protein
MFSIKHLFQSSKADGTDNTLVKPSDWNKEHQVLASTDGVVIGRAPGAGPGPMDELPVSSFFLPGMIIEYGGAVAPPGWMLCEGQSLERTAHPALFTAIGTTYGAVDATHFSLPDKRGRVASHPDGGTGRLPGYNIGVAGGAYYVPGSSLGVQVGGWFGGGGFTGSGYTTGQQTVQVYVGTSGVQGGNWYGGIVGGGDVLHGDHTHIVNGGFWTDGQNLNVYINSFGASGGVTSQFNIIQPTIAIPSIIKL